MRFLLSACLLLFGIAAFAQKKNCPQVTLNLQLANPGIPHYDNRIPVKVLTISNIYICSAKYRDQHPPATMPPPVQPPASTALKPADSTLVAVPAVSDVPATSAPKPLQFQPGPLQLSPSDDCFLIRADTVISYESIPGNVTGQTLLVPDAITRKICGPATLTVLVTLKYQMASGVSSDHPPKIQYRTILIALPDEKFNSAKALFHP
jgi:hypothetical protein